MRVGVGDVHLARRHLGRLIRASAGRRAAGRRASARLRPVLLIGLVARAARRPARPPAARPPTAAARRASAGSDPGSSQRCCSSWRWASRSHPSRPCTRATIRSASNSYSGSRSALAARRPRPARCPPASRSSFCARLAEELAPPLRGAQLLGQLITTRLAELLILGLVGRLDLGHDLPRDLLELLVALRAGVRRDPRAIDRHHPRASPTPPRRTASTPRLNRPASACS